MPHCILTFPHLEAYASPIKNPTRITNLITFSFNPPNCPNPPHLGAIKGACNALGTTDERSSVATSARCSLQAQMPAEIAEVAVGADGLASLTRAADGSKLLTAETATATSVSVIFPPVCGGGGGRLNRMRTPRSCLEAGSTEGKGRGPASRYLSTGQGRNSNSNAVCKQ